MLLVAPACTIGGRSTAGRAERPPPPPARWVRPASAGSEPFRYADLITFDEAGRAQLGGAVPTTEMPLPVVAAFALLHVGSGPAGRVADLPEQTQDDLEQLVDRVASGDTSWAVDLAEILTLERLSEGRIEVVTDADRRRLVEAIGTVGTADDPELGRTLLLRIELALRLDDPAEADRIARLPETFACALAEGDGPTPSTPVALLGYELARPRHGCVAANADRLVEAVGSEVTGLGAAALARSGSADAPAGRAALTSWVQEQVTAREAIGFGPSELHQVAMAVLALGTEPPRILVGSARRTFETSGFVSDVTASDYTLDVFLFADFDEYGELGVWAPNASTDVQLRTGGDWPALFVEGSGFAPDDPGFERLVARIRAGCGIEDTAEPPTAIMPPFAIPVQLALGLTHRPCDELDPEAVLDAVRADPRMPVAATPVVRTWAATYVACRFTSGSAGDDALRVAVRPLPRTAAKPWDLATGPAEYFQMFDTYAAGWLDAFLAGGGCRTLTPWNVVR